jgi:hypothetical protein
MRPLASFGLADADIDQMFVAIQDSQIIGFAKKLDFFTFRYTFIS